METLAPQQNKMIVVTDETLTAILSALLPPLVDRGIKSFKEDELMERLLSPDETRNLFTPAISKPTLDSYAEKGHFKKYYLEGRTWYKYSEVINAMKSIKRYDRSK